jgi:hypothetical protein
MIYDGNRGVSTLLLVSAIVRAVWLFSSVYPTLPLGVGANAYIGFYLAVMAYQFAVTLLMTAYNPSIAYFGKMQSINMELGAALRGGTLKSGSNTHGKPKKKKRNVTHRKFGLVTVGTGEGLIEAFTGMGADIVIDGGQGNNPSIETFIEAFDDCNADVIFVLPNNSNIIMAAKQAKEMYTKSDIRVLPTKNLVRLTPSFQCSTIHQTMRT